MYNLFIGLANVLMVLTSLFLICLVLIQRGKGGGLAGAFGGVGGSSAFGTKAGDVFTRVTIYVAIVWFILAMVLVYTSNANPTSAFDNGGTAGSAPGDDSKSGRASDKAGSETDVVPRTAPSTTIPAGGTVPFVPANPAKAALEPTSAAPATPTPPKP